MMRFDMIYDLWLVSTNVNENLIEKWINVLKNFIVVFIVVILSHMYMFQEEWTNDMGQVR